MSQAKKRSIVEDERRMKLLSRILDKWVYVKYHDGVKESYVFVKHRMKNENSTSKLEQALMSGIDYQDGIYLITDYDVRLVYDRKAKKELVELIPKKFDLKVGKYADEEITENYEELKQHMIGAKYLTEEEFKIYCQSTNKPAGMEEMLLSFDTRKR